MLVAVDRDHENWQAVARAVRRRREDLGLTQMEATALTEGSGRKISFATWRKVETAVEPPYTRATVAAVCHALGWEPDAFDRIRAGDQPRLTSPTGSRSIEERLRALEESRGVATAGATALTVEERLARLEALEGLRS